MTQTALNYYFKNGLFQVYFILTHSKLFRYQFFEAHSFEMAFEKLYNELSVTQACFLMPALITVVRVRESTKLQKHSSK